MQKRYWVAGVVVLFVALSWLKPVEQLATDYADQGLKRAVATFAAARALNAVISVVQGTEMSAGFGVGVTVAPGQALDPLNDLVEQFSKLMLFASVAFGVQLMLIKMGGAVSVSITLTLIAIAWIWIYVQGQRPPVLLSRALVALLFVRFIVPVATLTSELAFDQFMKSEYQQAQSSIEMVSDELQGVAPLDEQRTDEVRRWWEIRGKIDDLKDRAASLVDDTIRLTVVFIIQTLLIPLLVLWVLIRTSGLVIARASGARSSGTD